MSGKLKPTQFLQFGKGCTPDMLLGALIDSSEGTHAAYWQSARTVCRAKGRCRMNASSPTISRKALCDTHATMAHGGGRALRNLIDAVFTSLPAQKIWLA